MPPLKLAVVGGGPSAWYVAARLLQLLPPSHARAADLRIHIYDRLWAPHGLVRYGVAPDHPDVKNCTHKFDAAAADPRVRFFGNVHVGAGPPAPPHAVALPLSTLFPHYTHLLLASGAPTPRTLPHLPYARPALDLVHWYTHHPDAPRASPLPKGAHHITLLGLGNVVLDVARLLLTHPTALARLDVPAHVLAALTETWATLRHVAIVGRRGPRAARWAPRELRELLALPDARMDALPPHILDAAPTDPAPSRAEARVLQLLRAGSTAAPEPAPKTFSIMFNAAPTAQPTPQTLTLNNAHTLHTDLVLASLGFRGAPGSAPAWFDDGAGHVRHAGARVLDAEGRVVRGVYTAGWAAHGARGVIAGTLLDARAVAARIVADQYGSGSVGVGVEQEAADADVDAREVVDMLPHDAGEEIPEAVARGVAAGDVLGYGEWARVDAEERRRGTLVGKERERMAWEDVRAFLGSA